MSITGSDGDRRDFDEILHSEMIRSKAFREEIVQLGKKGADLVEIKITRDKEVTIDHGGTIDLALLGKLPDTITKSDKHTLTKGEMLLHILGEAQFATRTLHHRTSDALKFADAVNAHLYGVEIQNLYREERRLPRVEVQTTLSQVSRTDKGGDTMARLLVEQQARGLRFSWEFIKGITSNSYNEPQINTIPIERARRLYDLYDDKDLFKATEKIKEDFGTFGWSLDRGQLRLRR